LELFEKVVSEGQVDIVSLFEQKFILVIFVTAAVVLVTAIIQWQLL
jgi:hypothetical protein